MIRNYLLTALRSFWKNKTFSFINVLGLALGIACSLLIMLWVWDEKSVDSFHANGKRLYQIYEKQYFDNKKEGGYYTPGLLPAEMKKVLPEVELSTGYAWTEANTFEAGNKILKEEGNAASADFFKIFSYPLLAGNINNALNDPASIAISRKMAADFFGSPQSAMGKTIRYQNRADFKVTAVFEDLPANSSQKFDYLLSWEKFLKEQEWAANWGNNGPATFVVLRKDADPVAFEKKIKKFLDNYNKEQSAAFRIELFAQRFDESYLHSNFKNGEITGGRVEYVNLFSIVAIFILLIACINFMNLTTARSMKRAKEIGIRKVVGAVRPALMRQFIGEAILIAFMATLIALALVTVLLPSFNILTRKEISLPLSSPVFWLSLAGLTVATGVVSGSYPALFLSSFHPIRVLKGTLRFGSGATLFRKGLVVFQFILSIVLIIGTIVVSNQFNYIQNKNLGYDRQNLVYIPLEGDLVKKYRLFKDEALKQPGIKMISRISQSPTQIANGTGGVDWDGKDPNTLPMFTQVSIGYDFVKTMNLQMKEGREFSKSFPTDSVGYIVNEEALTKINYKDPIGKRLTFWDRKGTIVGVMKNFHFNSMHTPIQPLIVRLGEEEQWGWALVRTEAGKTKQAMAGLEKICKQLNPKFPFAYRFSDEEYQKLYKSEQVVKTLADYFAFLAIFISCLGLLGLAIFTAEQRTREIGIRKVLGASIVSLFTLLSKEFLLLVCISMLVAVPIAWWALSNWLEDYTYRIQLAWWMFIVAGIAAIIIALATVSWQALKAALANPVKALRSE